MAIVAIVSAEGTAGVLDFRNAAQTGFMPGVSAYTPAEQEARNAVAEARVSGLDSAPEDLSEKPTGSVVPAPSRIVSSFPEIPNLQALVNSEG